MKIINPEAIHSSEKEFIDTINAELDWEVIEKMLLEKHKFAMRDEVDYKQGDLVVFHDQIAYRFDFDIKVALSVVFGRDGKCLEISTSGDPELKKDPDTFTDPLINEDESQGRDALKKYDQSETLDVFEKQDISKMAEDIADMISDINQGDDE